MPENYAAINQAVKYKLPGRIVRKRTGDVRYLKFKPVPAQLPVVQQLV